MIQRISLGKYRYRGHIIWYDDFAYCCSPDPSDWHIRKKTLREIVRYIDDWETAFACGNVYGNIIGASQSTIAALFESIKKMNEAIGKVPTTLSLRFEPMKWSDVLVDFPPTIN